MHADPSTGMLPTDTDGRDDRWFEPLYPHLHRVACVVAPADTDPDDLVQEALVRYLQLGDPARVRSPRAYLTASVVNLASNERRSWARRLAALARLDPPDDARDEYPSDLGDLELLPPRERAVLYLHNVDGLPYGDVGALLGCSAAAARKAAERGRRRLDHLTGEEGSQ